MTIRFLNIFIRFGHIRRRTSKSSEFGLNFACFWPLKFFWGVPSEILDRDYKIGPITDHRAKFHAGRPTHLGDLARKEKNITRKTEVLPKTMTMLFFNYGCYTCNSSNIHKLAWQCNSQVVRLAIQRSASSILFQLELTNYVRELMHIKKTDAH